MKVHILQHAPFEDIGSMADWLSAHDAEWTYTHLFDNAALPPVDGFDLIISMGGPMSVNDEAEFPWIISEKQFLRDAVNRGIAVLGVCLGAQILASSLGARVYRNPEKEIGWFAIESTLKEGNTFRFPPKAVVFHWHGETFDLPAGSVHLARSRGCENQAFQIGRHVIGLQFHLEAVPEGVQALIDNCRDDLVPGPYVQGEAGLRNASETDYVNIHKLMAKVLSYLTGIRD